MMMCPTLQPRRRKRSVVEGTAPFVACPPSVTTLIPPDTGPGARSLSTRAGAMLGSPEESSANTSARPQPASEWIRCVRLNICCWMAVSCDAHASTEMLPLQPQS